MVRWLGGVVVRASDLWSKNREFDIRSCTTCMGNRLRAGKLSRYL